MPKPKPLSLTAITRIALALLFFSFHFYSNSQTLNWAFKAGGASRDESTNIHVDNAGNVLMTGLFSGTIDFDPSAAVFNLTSAGSEDIFVAKYTSTGAFLWAFRIGGTDRDHGLGITCDPNNNVIVTGFFRGSNIDFDPSAATANLTSNGDAGADPGYGGDIFIAKYTPAGNYIWALNVGGSELYDSGIAVVSDAASNVYVGGYFKGIVDFDPGAGTSNLNSATGTIFLSKYSPAGNYQWAFNTGLGDNNNAIFDLKADNTGNIYVAGYFQGTNIDFDPSPAVNALSSNGGYEIFYAKYNTNGQYVFAHSIGGTGDDVARGIDIDNNGNIYVIGDFSGANIDFDPGAGTALLNTNGGSRDVFLAKFNSAGNYVWAFNFGGSGSGDIGWKVSTDNSHLFITGGFNGTSDMNPSAVVDNLISNGGNDIFLGKYNLNGEYLCAFNIGGSFDDYGSAIRTTGTNIFYLTGFFQGNNVDFDPTAGTFNMSSTGGNDVFLSKFTWPDNTPPDGTIAAGPICLGQQAQMVFNATAGTGPFTIVYNNGTTNITVNNVQSGVPFNITPNPNVTTTYTLVSIRDASRCSETRQMNGITITVIVSNCTVNCTYWPVFGSGYSSPIPFSNTVSFSYNNASSLLPNTTYSTMTPGNWFTPNPTVATTSPPNSTPHNTSDIGAIAIFPTVVNNFGTINFASPTTTGFYLHVYQTVSQLDFDHSFTLVSSDGDLHVGSSGSLINNVLIPDVGPLQSPDDANATIYFPPGISQIKFTITSAPLVQLDGIKLAFTFPDNCLTATTTIINDYTPVISLDVCKNIINVGDASPFNIGDTVLLIQMKGAVIDSTNTSAFGTVTNYKNAGNYEYNYIKAKNGNSIELLNKIERQYDLPDGKVQLISVPYFQDYTIPANTTLSCLPWNGSVGGVLVFNTQNTLTLNGNIDVSGKGFRGGQYNFNPNYTCDIDSFYLRLNNGSKGANKGESIFLNNTLQAGRGKSANGGGGGNATNAGGAGGGNGGAGGTGGKQYVGPLCNTNFTNGGLGGTNLSYSNASNKIFLGGGGGAGHGNEVNLGNGGNGGGIVIISANTITANSYSILSNGATPVIVPISPNDDGRSGGGSGGAVLLKYQTLTGNLNVSAAGGKGDDAIVNVANSYHGPGGGGGGGVVWVNQPSITPALVINTTGGTNGVNTNLGNNAWGATAGANGISLTNLVLPITTTLFKPNIDSVRIKDSLKTCTDFDFKGLAYTNTNPVASWQWYFGDGQTANTQNTSHTYAPGNYTVKLVITDINGCKDSTIKNIIATTLTVNAGNDTTICNGQSITLQGSTNGGTQFQWNNAPLLNNNTILTPVATPTGALTTFIITATNAAGCSKSDSVNVLVRTQNTFSINAPSPICPNGTAQLLAQGGDTYLWQSLPGNNATIPNPIVSPSTSTIYSVQITDTVCNQTQNLSTQVVVLSLPNVQAFKQNDIDCIQTTARLNASGAVNYKWTPALTLNNSNISNPVANPVVTTLYTVEGTDAAGCKNTDTISVIVDFSNKNGLFFVPNAFTPNNDGLNDCFGIKHWGVLESVEFNIYNRWGELVFHTTDVTKCWDGKWKGREQDPAVFVYWIKAKSICGGDVFRKGTIVLIR